MVRYEEIGKRQRNAIRKRILNTVNKYGFDEVRLITNRYFKEELDKDKLQTEIHEKERELMNLKNSRCR